MSSQENKIAALLLTNEQLRLQLCGTRENTGERETEMLSANYLTPVSNRETVRYDCDHSASQETTHAFDGNYISITANGRHKSGQIYSMSSTSEIARSSCHHRTS
jgi:hypothetical protein